MERGMSRDKWQIARDLSPIVSGRHPSREFVITNPNDANDEESNLDTKPDLDSS